MTMPVQAPVLVTGGAGFLGRAIVGALSGGDAEVRTLQRGTPPAFAAAALQGDIRDEASVARALQGCGAAIHAAGLAHVFADGERAPFTEVNTVGTDVVARAAAAAGVGHLVLVSSVAVYGASADHREDAACAPAGPYAQSKAAAEQRAMAVAAAAGMRLTILRMATVYGEGDRGNVQRLIEALARRRFVWIGDGANRKSLIHVADAGRACTLPLTSEGDGIEIYNVGGPPVTMAAIVEAACRALQRDPPLLRIPAPAGRLAGALAAALSPSRGARLQSTLDKWLRDDVYPADRFVDRFGFRPRVTLDDGMARQVASWRALR